MTCPNNHWFRGATGGFETETGWFEKQIFSNEKQVKIKSYDITLYRELSMLLTTHLGICVS